MGGKNMKKRSFSDTVHLLGRITVLVTISCFILLAILLALGYGIPIQFGKMLSTSLPLFFTFALTAICENVSYAPIIGCGALYMACVTGNVSNMKVPASINAMEISGYTSGSEKGDIISIIAVASSTFVTTIIVFLGMLFLAPIFEPVYNNVFLQPGFKNLVPALFGAILFPMIGKAKMQAIIPVLMPIILSFICGRSFFSQNQSYLMVAVILVSVFVAYQSNKKKQTV